MLINSLISIVLAYSLMELLELTHHAVPHPLLQQLLGKLSVPSCYSWFYASAWVLIAGYYPETALLSASRASDKLRAWLS
jgi:hypothetical protein